MKYDCDLKEERKTSASSPNDDDDQEQRTSSTYHHPITATHLRSASASNFMTFTFGHSAFTSDFHSFFKIPHSRLVCCRAAQKSRVWKTSWKSLFTLAQSDHEEKHLLLTSNFGGYLI